MPMQFKHIILSAVLVFAAAPLAYAQSSGVGTQFTAACESDNVTFGDLRSHVSGQGWSQITEEGVIEAFFPDMASGGLEDAAVFEARTNNSQAASALYLGVMKARVEEGLILVCQLRSYGSSADGLREDFEKVSKLSGVKVPSPEDSEVYSYNSGNERFFYDLWERKFGEGEHVFAVGKTILYPARSSN